LLPLWKIGGFSFILVCLSAGASNVTPVVCTAVMADSIDFGEWKTGVRAQGFISAFFVMGNKVGMALGGAVIGLGLAYFDYLPNLTQYPESTLSGILILFIAVPILIRALISVVMLFFNLSESRMAEIIAELNSAKA
jgi:Na+/melibiose symporter-like transporter